MSRDCTNKLLEMVADELIDKDTLISNLVCWMSEAEVKEFMEANEYLEDEKGQYIIEIDERSLSKNDWEEIDGFINANLSDWLEVEYDGDSIISVDKDGMDCLRDELLEAGIKCSEVKS